MHGTFFKEPGGLGGGGDTPSPKSVWADAHGLDLKAGLGDEPKLLKLKLKNQLHPHMRYPILLINFGVHHKPQLPVKRF